MELDDLDAHRSGGAAHLLLGRLEIVGVEVWELGLGDFGDLRLGHRAGLLTTRVLRGLLEPGGLAQEHGSRRGLEHERERPVLEDRDLDGDDRATLLFGRLLVYASVLNAVRMEERGIDALPEPESLELAM